MREHHHAGVADRFGQHTPACAQPSSRISAAAPPSSATNDAEHQPERQRGAGDGLHLVHLAGAPGLPMSTPRPAPMPMISEMTKKTMREHRRHGRERPGAEHLADEDVVERAR